MSDNRKYYYLKLKENYFDEDAIVLLESMQDGIHQRQKGSGTGRPCKDQVQPADAASCAAHP